MGTLIKNITRLEAFASLNKSTPNISMARSFIRDYKKVETDIEDIQSIIAGYFDIPKKELISSKRHRAYSYPRQIAMYFSRKYSSLSYKEIGEYFGQKDHSTVIYAVKRIDSLKAKNKKLQKDLINIERMFT